MSILVTGGTGLVGSVLRLGFVYCDKDGHLDSVPKLAEMFKWHPANRLSMIHHRDIEMVVKLALTGALDGRIVNIVDEAPMSIFEINEYVGATVESSSEPLAHLVGPARWVPRSSPWLPSTRCDASSGCTRRRALIRL